eukprot:TRINITY_DN14358_c0_g1_i1.p1 TRINITY_DN14358_c0_g1~~TRINITY_DN14358_c0_g1_i1.p1  ORF type:complete len:310 (-),score=56.81 TRINITY_DN14358_c0_g1_i1:18-947(-)
MFWKDSFIYLFKDKNNNESLIEMESLQNEGIIYKELPQKIQISIKSDEEHLQFVGTKIRECFKELINSWNSKVKFYSELTLITENTTQTKFYGEKIDIVFYSCKQNIPFNNELKKCNLCGLSHLIEDKYSLFAPVGKGGFGIVYKAGNVLTEEIVAIKQRTKNNPKNLESWNREVFNHKRIQEIPNLMIPKLLEILNENTYSMEWIEGYDLSFIKDNSTIKNEIDFVRMGVILNQNLYILHSNDFYHCDIKPSNIMLFKDEYSKLTFFMFVDYGSASKKGENYIKTFSKNYTPKDDVWDSRSDVFSLDI